MRKFTMIFAAAMLLTSNVSAMCNGWERTDTYLAIGYSTFLALDYLQTRNFLADPERREANPIVGPRPTHDRLAAINLLTLGAVIGGACYLDVPLRRALLAGAFTAEILVVLYNERAGRGLGVRISF